MSKKILNIAGPNGAGATVKESLTVQIELWHLRTAEESSLVQIEGGRELQGPVTLYNLDAQPSAFYPS